jgi:hypothetical protein
MFSRFLLVLLPTLSLFLSACGLDDGTPPPTVTPEQRQQADIEAYRALAGQLEQRRTEFLPKTAMEIQAVKGRLFWLDFSNFNPILHSSDPAAKNHIKYGFSIGGSAYNYGASDSLVVTAQRSGDALVYRAYNTKAANELIAELKVPAPTDEQRWWAYAVDGGTVYYVRTTQGAELLKWVPGVDIAPTKVLSLADTGAEVGVFWDFAIEGDQMLFTESGRLWRLDLRTRTSTWLENSKQVSGPVQFDEAGALYNTAGGLLFHDNATGQVRNLSEELKSNSYKLSETFSTAHHLSQSDATRRGNTVYYIGQKGLFSYTLDTHTVKPLLLSPHDPKLTITYRYPQVLDDGTLFVVGLTSTSGSVGADGPVYRITPEP